MAFSLNGATIHGVSRWLETFSDHHQHTISLFEATGTVSAVVVALLTTASAKRATRPRIKARIFIQHIWDGNGSFEDSPSYLVVRLTNVGTVPARLNSNFFHWKMMLTKTAWLAMPLDQGGDEFIPVHLYPFFLEPNTMTTIFLTRFEQFVLQMPQILESCRFGRRRAPALLRAIVRTDDGREFYGAFDGSFQREIGKLSRATSAGE